MSIKKIAIKGVEQTFAAGTSSNDDVIELRKSYIVGSTVRGITETHEIDIDKDDLVELVFNDDTVWYCNNNTLDEVFPEAETVKRSGNTTFEIPAALTNADAERGIAGSILLKGLNIFAKKAITAKVKDIASDLEKKQLENMSGLYTIDANFQLQEFSPSPDDKTYLLFLHGTGSSTKGSFGELVNTELWKYIVSAYGNNILAFQHETLTKSPLQNVLDLVKALPKNISFDIISHSRGGLVGDTLARFCNTNENIKGFDDNEIAYLKKSGDRANDLANIEAIKAGLANKKVRVNKFIRVACPAQGTTLASKRMDHFFNVTFNLIGLASGIAANPAYGAFKNLIATVIDCKNEVDVLPGVEAMNPDSPFIKVLNSPATNVVLDQQLLIVSGNCKTKFNLKALLIIVSKLFYLKDNDLVVNTRSMYSGTKRETPVQYLFDEATDVDHFHYFKNKKTNDGIMMALKTTGQAQVPGFSLLDVSTLAAMDRNALLKLDGGKVFTDTVTGTKPIAVVLPGIMGSNLSDTEHSIWINYLRFISGGLMKLDVKNNDITAPSIVSTSYKQLVRYLSTDYDVVTFPFDWRHQLGKVAETLNDKINSLLAFRQPIKLIGHSMGGVLVRDFIIGYPDTWKKLNESEGFRLLFLGSPLGGSYRIPAVLAGKDAIIEKLAKIDIFHTKSELIGLFAKMPGLLSLLPITTDDGNDFAKQETWTTMMAPLADQLKMQASDLTEFQKYRDNIIASSENIDFSKAVYIAGKDAATPCGYRIDETNTGKELVFLSTAEGDQSVTWESGIPKKMIANNSVYYVNVSHGALANEPSIFKGITDILSTGFTNTLSKLRPEIRGTQKVFKTPDQHDFDITPDGVANTLLGLDTTSRQQVVGELPLRVSISNGDLRYASYPLLAGHFAKDGIVSAEKEIDGNMDFALSEMNKLSIYPGNIGSSEIFVNTNIDFNGAIIVGLGDTNSFSAYQLTTTIEQGICKYLLILERNGAVLNNVQAANGNIGVSSLIVGSGYGGLSIEDSIRAIMQGIQNANAKIKKIRPEFAHTVQYLEFVELFEDAALSCFYSISKIEKEENSSLNILKDIPKMKTLLGSRKRIQSQSSEGWWNRITVQLEKNDQLSPTSRCLLFNASTGAAREQQRKLYSSPKIIEKIIDDISSNNMWSPELARTIFELLIPNDFKEQLTRQCNVNWILDKNTASYPWELLQDRVPESIPLCVSGGMIRQLATQDDRMKINLVSKNSALVIGDPFLDGYVVQLPGAYKEAEMVSGALTNNEFESKLILRGTAPEIIKNLFADDYKIIHLAGHGNFSPDAPETSGMIIGKEIFLTTAEIAQMTMTPELVFVNCCFLGKTEGVAEELYQSRYKLAANIGTQLIENGVKAVVVAGWAVDDAAAMDFCKTFYNSMFDGETFGEAVHKARKSIYDKYHTVNNTWGAYQCYGDPFYRFEMRHRLAKKFAPVYVITEEAEIALGNLRNEMDMGHYDEKEMLARLTAVSDAVDNAGLRTAKITEREAFIYADMYEYDKAIEKFTVVMASEAASFSVKTLEKYCNVRAKKCVSDFLNNGNAKKLLKEMDVVIKDLTILLDISRTAERYSLLGSSYKRRTILTAATEQKIKSLQQAAYYYMKAHFSPANDNPAYSLCNWMEIENLLVLSGDRNWGNDITVGKETYKLAPVAEALNELQTLRTTAAKTNTDLSYWTMLSVTNLKLCQLVLVPSSASDDKAWDDVFAAYRKIWAKAGSKGSKLTEIEHQQLLSEGLGVSKKRDVAKLKKRIDALKDELVKIT